MSKKTPDTLSKKDRTKELNRIKRALVAEMHSLSTVIVSDSVQFMAELPTAEPPERMTGLGAAAQNVTRAVHFIEENIRLAAKPKLAVVSDLPMTEEELNTLAESGALASDHPADRSGRSPAKPGEPGG